MLKSKRSKTIALGLGMVLVLCMLAALCGYLFVYPGRHRIMPSNPHSYATIGDIPTPAGYKRIEGNDASYTEWLRGLGLKPKGTKIRYYTGGKSRFQRIGYAVVDMKLLSNYEQCADVCMRLRSEYLYEQGAYQRIKFRDVNGSILRYEGGRDRKAFEAYLRHLYGVANTYSLSRDMPRRALKDIQPGDVFVYPAPSKGRLGHAVMVVDVARNDNGETAILLAEGNTPARSIHVLNNTHSPSSSPWFFLDKEAKWSALGFDADDLRYFN